jgi:GntR family transcriptional repressor for pyruvate dehydrogenase complex
VSDDPLVSEKVFTFFKEQFAAGHLSPGDRLLPERELAQRLGVSRPTLREVMRAMALLGVIDIRPGQKAIVTSPSADVLGDFFGMLLSMRPSIYEHILEARIAIECQAARLACANAQSAEIEQLEAALGRILETAADDETGADADFAFHAQLVAASHNEVLRFIHEAIGALLRRSHHERRKAVSGEPDFLATLGEAHQQVIDAIVARDPDAAEAVVRRHFYIAQEHRAKRGRVSGVPARNAHSRPR